jgi:2-polyprenyl-3-methyl-5-hydroxy-6-metoxy-1,4-benzoquinol methylase
MKTLLRLPRSAVSASDIGDQEAHGLWERTIDPEGIGVVDAIAGDIASFTGEPIEVVVRKMASGKDDFKELWLEGQVNADDASSVTSFYREQFTEAYELADWHCGRLNGTPPLNYARAALFAQRNGLRRVLDFGSGIGTGSLAFATVGCEVYAADIAQTLQQFVSHRFQRRGWPVRTIDLLRGEPPTNFFDVITAFDVLEHIPDQLATMRRLQSYLRVGGYLFVNLMNDSHHEDRPMHISSAGDWLRMMRRTALRPDWANCVGDMQVFVRLRTGRLYNIAASCIDWVEGS